MNLVVGAVVPVTYIVMVSRERPGGFLRALARAHSPDIGSVRRLEVV